MNLHTVGTEPPQPVNMYLYFCFCFFDSFKFYCFLVLKSQNLVNGVSRAALCSPEPLSAIKFISIKYPLEPEICEAALIFKQKYPNSLLLCKEKKMLCFRYRDLLKMLSLIWNCELSYISDSNLLIGGVPFEDKDENESRRPLLE